MNIQGVDTLLPVSHLTSARLGVATIAISPLNVAASMDAIRQLSRSGLDEILRGEPIFLEQEVSVILLDVDYLKAINDNFGHDAGDSVLEEIARRVQRVVGKEGRISSADKNLYLSKRNGRNQTSPVNYRTITSDVA